MEHRRAGEEYDGPYQAIVSGSQFVAAVEIGDATPTLRIDSVRVATVESMDPGKPAADKLIVYFTRTTKGWIVNSTNGKCIAAMFGDDVRGWKGKRITLVVEQVRFGGKTVPGIRVKGSPDIDRAIKVEIKMPRKRATFRELVQTGGPRQSDPGGQTQRRDRGQDPAADALAAVHAKLRDWSVDDPREFDDAVPRGFDIEACGLDEGQALLDERER